MVYGFLHQQGTKLGLIVKVAFLPWNGNSFFILLLCFPTSEYWYLFPFHKWKKKKKKCLCPMIFFFFLFLFHLVLQGSLLLLGKHVLRIIISQGVSFDSVWWIQWIMVFTVFVIAVSHQPPPVKVCVRMKRIQRWKKKEEKTREWGCLEGTHVTGIQWWKGHNRILSCHHRRKMHQKEGGWVNLMKVGGSLSLVICQFSLISFLK